MATHIGGRLETVAPKRSLFGPDYVRLLGLVAAAVAVHGWLLAHTALTSRDSLEFARNALIIETPAAAATFDHPPDPDRQVVDVLKKPYTLHPPGFPLATLAVSKVLRAATDLPLPEVMPLSAQVANALAGVLLVFPTYLLGRMLFGRSAGFAAALLVQVLPVYAQTTSDGMSDGLYLLAAVTTLVLGVRAVRRPNVGPFLLTGMASGFGYLVRPEGLVLPVATVGTVFLLWLTRVWSRNTTAASLCALAVGFGIVGGPYMKLIGGVTNKTTGERLLSPGGGSGVPNWRGGAAAASPNPALMGVWWNEATDGGSCKTLWGLKAVARETLKTAHYAPAVLGLLGMVYFRRRLVVDPGPTFLILTAGVNLAVVLVMTATTPLPTPGLPDRSPPYVSERHTMLVGVILCLFAAAMLEPLTAALARLPVVGRLWAGRHAASWFLVAIVLSALPNALKSLHKNRVGHLHAGHFLAANAGPDDAVIDPFSWAQWHAGRTLYCIPKDPPEDNLKVRWAVVEHITAENPHSRLPRLRAALDVVNDRVNPPTVAYHWPEDVPPERAKVLVYKQVVRK